MKFHRLVKHTLKTFLGYKAEGIGIILTRRCNLTCAYCKIKDNSEKTKNTELSLDQWQTIIDKFTQKKHQHFIFTGGEPLLFPDVYKLIDYTSKKAMTSLITNTTLLNEENFSNLKNLDFLTFSADTAGENNIFEKNANDKLKLIHNNCKKYNIDPAAIITITAKNIEEVPTIIKELTAYKIPALLSIIHSSASRQFEFRGNTPELEFSTDAQINELKTLQNTLLQMKREKYLIAERNDFIKNMSEFCQNNYQIKCPAGDKFMTIDVNGQIKVCHDIPASSINALSFTDYNEMKNAIKQTIPKTCNCYYDCYYNSQYSLINRLLHHASRI